MGIFSRFADIVNSNINALLDKAEDPEKMIRLIIQEMEDTLVEVRTNSAKTIADKKELERKITWLEKNIADWESKAELALSKGRDDLAKAALLEKKRVREQALELSEQLVSINHVLEKLSVEIGQLEEKLADARSRQKTLVMRAKTNQSRLKIREKLYDGRGEDAITRFERFERQIEKVEAKTEALDLGRKQSLSDQIDSLADNEEIDAELAELKSKMNKGSSDKSD